MVELGNRSIVVVSDASECKSQGLPIALQDGQLQSQTHLFTFSRSYIATFLLGNHFLIRNLYDYANYHGHRSFSLFSS